MATISSPARSHGSSPSRCLCSPTTHPGSFRCSFHRNFRGKLSTRSSPGHAGSSPGRAESKAVGSKAKSFKALLIQIIGPSRNNLYRRRNFQPKPTRFGLMNRNDRAVAVV